MRKDISRRAFVRGAAALGGAVCAGGLRVCAVAADPARAVDIGLEPQVFLDDALVEKSSGLERRTHRPRKAGLIEEAGGQPWQMGDQLAVARDTSGRFHMTYRFFWWDPSVRDLHPSIGDDRAHWFRESVGYATSEDGIRWTKPRLGLLEAPSGFHRAPEAKWKDGVFFEPSGFSKENNLGHPLHMLQDLGAFGGVDDPGRRYLLSALKKSDTHPFAEVADAGLYFASDIPDLRNPGWRGGLQAVWEGKRRGPRGPAVRVAGFDSRQKVWFECAQGSFGAWRARGGRDIARWTSADLQDWSKEELVLPIAGDERRDPKDWVEYMDIRVFRAGGLWLGQLIIFHGDRSDPQAEMPTARGVWRKGTTELRLVSSRDAGKTWQRAGGKEAWIPCHEADDGHDRLVFTASPVRAGDELWLYYGCWDGDHLVWNRDGTTYYRDRMRAARTARAVLRWNGFASLGAGDASGEVTTTPLLSPGRRLEINADAGRGSVRVEVQDESGKPFAGYSLADSDRLTSSGVAQRATWRAKQELSGEAAGKPFRLRFEVKGAELYGFAVV